MNIRALKFVFLSLFYYFFQYEFEASFLEIYNETIRDLLGNNSDDQKHDIKMTGSADKKDVMVTNLTTVMVTSEDQVSLLNITIATIIERGKIIHCSMKIDCTSVMNDRLGYLYS